MCMREGGGVGMLLGILQTEVFDGFLIVLNSMKIPLFANFLGSLLTLHLVHSFTDCYMYVASLMISVSVCTVTCV